MDYQREKPATSTQRGMPARAVTRLSADQSVADSGFDPTTEVSDGDFLCAGCWGLRPRESAVRMATRPPGLLGS